MSPYTTSIIRSTLTASLLSCKMVKPLCASDLLRRNFTSTRSFQREAYSDNPSTSSSIRGVSESGTRVLVTGSCGQIGADLIPILQSRYGRDSVTAADVQRPKSPSSTTSTAKFIYCDVQDRGELRKAVVESGASVVVHLASVLSAAGERDPSRALAVNIQGSQNVLDIARDLGLKVFAPSTIAVFGPSTPKVMTPDHTITEPTTMYGITKVHLELMGTYYHEKFGVDFRSLRYPGIISSSCVPGGGTTDYAVDIYHEALKTGAYKCYLKGDTALPMMYMPDCLKATVDLMEAPRESLSRCVYNIGSMTFTPSQLAEALRAQLPFDNFKMDYEPDYRQDIANTWPQSIDDSLARRDWGWNPEYDLQAMTKDMLEQLRPRYGYAPQVGVTRQGFKEYQQASTGKQAAYRINAPRPPRVRHEKKVIVINPCC